MCICLGFCVVACGDDDGDRRPDQAASAAEEAGLSAEVQDFFALAGAGPATTYAAVYASGDLEIRIAQRPPDHRLEVENPDGTTDLTLRRRGVTYQCHRTVAEWTCTRVSDLDPPAAVGFDPAAVAEAGDALRGLADDYSFTVEPRVVAGVDATCLVTTLLPGREDDTSLGRSATFCVSEIGVPLLIERPGERLTATQYSTDVDDGAFELPG